MSENYCFLIDSREQRPYLFRGQPSKKQGLKTGDYSISFNDVDYDHEIMIERKALDDFVGVCGKGRPRFIKELERSMLIPNFFIIIEGSWLDLEMSRYHSMINPNSVIESILGWQIKYGCHIILTETRQRGERLTKKLLLHFLKYKAKEYKEKHIAEGLIERN